MIHVFVFFLGSCICIIRLCDFTADNIVNLRSKHYRMVRIKELYTICLPRRMQLTNMTTFVVPNYSVVNVSLRSASNAQSRNCSPVSGRMSTRTELRQLVTRMYRVDLSSKNHLLLRLCLCGSVSGHMRICRPRPTTYNYRAAWNADAV